MGLSWSRNLHQGSEGVLRAGGVFVEGFAAWIVYKEADGASQGESRRVMRGRVEGVVDGLPSAGLSRG